ncbi:MAG: hypothetical protein M3Y07_15445 [Acidobacteriota bacterium]|nr:hypothetical protein [Acidobacteriota bacterium]
MQTFRTRCLWLLPSLSDCLFISIILWLFVAGKGWSLLLADGDTGWHIRTGEFILDTGSVPFRDLFSFSRAGAEWFSWEWLTDVCFAEVHRLAGLKGVVLVSGIAIAACVTVLFRHMIWRGANVMAALVVTLLAMDASNLHYLARPHVFTLLLLAVSAWIVDLDRRRETPWLWGLVPIAALWANLHGGFLALFVLLGGLMLDALAANRRRLWRYACITFACAAATLLNPYGWRLHAHIARYLTSDWILRSVAEFQSPAFRSEGLIYFEIMLLAGLALTTVLVTKKRYYEALLLLFWSQAALRSVRHVPLYVLVGAPILASEGTVLWNRLVAFRDRRSILGILRDVFDDFPRHCRRTSPWPVVLCVILALGWFAQDWPKDFPDVKFPVAALERNYALLSGSLREKTRDHARLLTSDQWGDYLIYRIYPYRRAFGVFIDGRSDFYGERIGKDYLDLMNAQAGWRGIMKRYDFNVALVPVNWPLSELLKGDSGWRASYHDALGTIFERTR